MSPYFADKSRQIQLAAALRERLGQSFVERSFECYDLVTAGLRAAGLPLDLLGDLPRTSLNHGIWHSHAPLIAFLQENPVCRERMRIIDRDDPFMSGDLIVLKETHNRSAHHLGILSGGLIFHLPRYCSVTTMSEVAARMDRLIHSAFRIYDAPFSGGTHAKNLS